MITNITTNSDNQLNNGNAVEISRRAHEIRLEINQLKNVFSPAAHEEYSMALNTARYLYEKLKPLVTDAHLAGIVNADSMQDSGVWVDNYKVHFSRGAGKYSVIPEGEEILGNRKKDDLFKTFKRAASHIQRYAQYAVSHQTPKGYGENVLPLSQA